MHFFTVRLTGPTYFVTGQILISCHDADARPLHDIDTLSVVPKGFESCLINEDQ